MAIINDLPGVEVTIVTGDTAYQEHIDEDTEEPRTITRYIEVKSEQNFHVAIKVEKGTTFLGDALQFRIMVDGVVVVKALVKKSKCRRRDYHTTRNGQSLPGSQVRPFKFNSMETVRDGHMLKKEALNIQNLGEIKIVVKHRTVLESLEDVRARKEINAPDFISEKALKSKSLSHAVGYGDAVQSGHVNRHSAKPVPHVSDPAAVFVFRYRSLDALKSMLIVPRTPSPEPEVPFEERDYDTLTPDQQREVFERLQARDKAAKAAKKAEQEQKESIKREQAEDNNPRPRKVARPQAGDTLLVIDEGERFRESSPASLGRIEKEIIELDWLFLLFGEFLSLLPGAGETAEKGSHLNEANWTGK